MSKTNLWSSPPPPPLPTFLFSWTSPDQSMALTSFQLLRTKTELSLTPLFFSYFIPNLWASSVASAFKYIKKSDHFSLPPLPLPSPRLHPFLVWITVMIFQWVSLLIHLPHCSLFSYHQSSQSDPVRIWVLHFFARNSPTASHLTQSSHEIILWLLSTFPLILPTHLFCSSHSRFLVIFKHSRHIPTSGSLHLLISLPKVLYPESASPP